MIIWTNDDLFSIETLVRNFSEISIKIQTFQFKKMLSKMVLVERRQWLVAWRHQAITWTNVRLITGEVLRHWHEINFTGSTQAIILYIEFKKLYF